MGEDRFNAFILLFLHSDIKIDIEKVINIFISTNPRRMLLQNPMLAEACIEIDIQCSC
jgi:hypothetical protein